ncbi:MAG: [Clostridia bacterium]|nr:[FeFe] hydrogenase H-cluster maturation GTPase HydF [Clostridia bacterium]
MSLNDTPLSQRLHISFFGCRNVGKSSLVNAVTGQDLSVVSDVKGTTTDPVLKTMELLPLGPVCIIDTPGLDDEGELGQKRIEKALRILDKTDIAILIADARTGLSSLDENLIKTFTDRKIPYIIAYNKSDLSKGIPKKGNEIFVSALTGENIEELKNIIGKLKSDVSDKRTILGDIIDKNDIAVLVTPIDESAPKGRIILPQQMVIRNILDCNAISVVTKETELEKTLKAFKEPPKMVITDSQVFKKVNETVPKDIPLTSFSILMARYNGYLKLALSGIKALDDLKDGDKVLIAEGCTHHRQCNDIGTVKIPNGLKKYTGKNFSFEFCSGTEFPKDLSGFSLVIHCGGCMLNLKEVYNRMKTAESQNIPVTNYGILLAQLTGTLKRSLEIFNNNF